jgi:uncharacterized membrane protein
LNVYAVVVGVALVLVAIPLVRFRAAIARWQIEGRVEALRRSSLMNEEYVQREIDAWRRPGSERLNRLLVVFVAIFLVGGGVYATLRGLAVV